MLSEQLHSKKSWFMGVVDVLFPITCWICKQKVASPSFNLCLTCQKCLSPCFLPYNWIKVGKMTIWKVYSLPMERHVRKLIHALKYQGYWELGWWAGLHYGKALRAHWSSYLSWDVIIPVPLHKLRLCRRTYNQSAPIAAGLAHSLNVDWAPNSLMRCRYTASQVGKSRSQRLTNVEHAFKVANPNIIAGRHIILVDDVCTTGATLNACAQALFSAGGARVSAVVLAHGI